MLKHQKSNVKKCVEISENYYVDIGLKELIIIGLVCLKKFDGGILAKYQCWVGVIWFACY